ncbi:hypothetical protein [Sphingomonas sp. CL5.1]|uniref:hypothetical protein n=1 Tax=Sphingomonas sp. CL5.1 TaxID=2653203 RepID=UPI001C2EF0D9
MGTSAYGSAPGRLATSLTSLPPLSWSWSHWALAWNRQDGCSHPRLLIMPKQSGSRRSGFAPTSVLTIIALLAGLYLGSGWIDPIMGIIGAVVIACWS